MQVSQRLPDFPWDQLTAYAATARAHPDGVVPQQYPPDALVGRDYYRPTGRGAEARLGERLAKLRAIVRRTR